MQSNGKTEGKIQTINEKINLNLLETKKLLDKILEWLSEAKSENLVSLYIADKSSIADYMIIASGRSDRHVGAIAEQLQKKLKEAGCQGVRVEGLEVCDWVLIDSGNIIVHIFRPQVREFYNLEKMWSLDRPTLESTN
ncbi:MAG: ribosome silencing factor [Hyphomicrobium sp.]